MMTKHADIATAPLSTRAKRALAKKDIHTIAELQRLHDEYGERHIRERMFGVGRVTAEEILEFLNEFERSN